jgi:hypothetical protein
MSEKKEDDKVTEMDAVSPAPQVSQKESQLPAKTGFDNINLLDPAQVALAEALILRLMRSDKSGIKSVQDGLAILARTQSLNLPFAPCIEHIHVINGKTGVDIHIIKALLLKAACTWRRTKDYQALYEYTDGINVYCDGALPADAVKCISIKEAEAKRKEDEANDYIYIWPVKWYSDFNGNIYKDYQLTTTKFGIVTNLAQAQALAKENKIGIYRIPNKPIDYITEYEITRTINGKTVTSTDHFSYTDAVAADMFSKDTYKKYARILIGHRAFTYAARDIASDVLFGVMETTELKIVAGKELDNADIVDIEAEVLPN